MQGEKQKKAKQILARSDLTRAYANPVLQLFFSLFKMGRNNKGKTTSKANFRANGDKYNRLKKPDKSQSPFDDDAPLSLLKRKTTQKKGRKNRIDEKRKSQKPPPESKSDNKSLSMKSVSSTKIKKKPAKSRSKKMTTNAGKGNLKGKGNPKENKSNIQSNVGTDPRLVHLPEDSESVSDLSGTMSKTEIEKQQERSSEEIENLYKRTMEPRVLKKGDVYKDQCGRLTTKGEELSVSSTSSNSEQDMSTDSKKDVMAEDLQDDHYVNEEAEGTNKVVGKLEQNKDDDSRSAKSNKIKGNTMNDPRNKEISKNNEDTRMRDQDNDDESKSETDNQDSEKVDGMFGT